MVSNFQPNYKRMLISIVVLILIIVTFSFLSTYKAPEKKIEDYTNKEMNQFLEWKENKELEKLENEKVFK